MMVTIFEVITVLSLILLTILTAFNSNGQRSLEGSDSILWTVNSRRIGTSRGNFRTRLLRMKSSENQADLGAGVYYFGNRLRDDLFLDLNRRNRTCLYCNVQTDRIYITILSGTVAIDSLTYESDAGRRIPIRNGDRMQVDNLELEFIKKRFGFNNA